MTPMTYKGYAARIEYSEEDGCFIGHITGITDIVGFHGETVHELRIAFKEAVDDYLGTCAKAGIAPQKPYSGKIMLRVSPELHAKAAMAAAARGKSLNALASEALEQLTAGL
jgi:predicted HicB family RNase H-like nuclease